MTICTRVGNSIHLLDPSTLQTADVTSAVYWRNSFDSLATVSDLVEFIVLDIEASGPTRGNKFVLADAQVAPNHAFRSQNSNDNDAMDVDGENGQGGTDAIYHTRTHLGGILQPGDTVLGYFLTRANFNSDAFDQLDSGRIPDVILVKKTYPNRRKKARSRNWKLKSIAKEAEEGVAGDEEEDERKKKKKGSSAAVGRGALGRRGGLDQSRVEADYEMFLRDLEEDPELRGTINLYRADRPAGAAGADGDETMRPAATVKRGGKGKSAYAMDAEPTGPVVVEGGEADEDEDEEDDEAGFPQIRMDELLDGFDELAIEGDEVEQAQE